MLVIIGLLIWMGGGLVANGFGLLTWDSNNHQQTWGVLGAALEALEDYMRGAGYGQVLFTIVDGPNQVGEGMLG